MQVPYKRIFPILLLIAAALPSCKSPTAPAGILSNPMLSISAPDSARVFDTVKFHAHYSDSIKLTWDYAWQFGDSTKASTRDTSISHIYDSAGTYTVQVNLTDTILHQTIAKQTAQIKIMPLNAPTLTLTVPDTNYWGDSCAMSVSSSQPMKAGWKFSWSLGDSTSVTGTDSVLHYYLVPRNYKVTVSLNDTVHHILLASQTAMISVAARHFNLALLQSMKYVVVQNGGYRDMKSMGGDCNFGDFIIADSPKWIGNNFSDVRNGVTRYSGYPASAYLQGIIDKQLTQILNFSDSGSANGSVTEQGFLMDAFSGSYSDNFNNIPLKSQSDSEVVFEAVGPIINASSYGSGQGFHHSCGSDSYTYNTIFDDTSRVIIRFHK